MRILEVWEIDWISIAWIAEENPGIRPMDACANFLSKGVIHLLLTIVLFYEVYEFT